MDVTSKVSESIEEVSPNKVVLGKGIYWKGRLIIFIMAAVTAILQGNYYTSVAFGADRQLEAAIALIIFIFASALFTSKFFSGKIGEESSLLYIVFGGMFLRVLYVLFTDIWTLQNDGGTFTGFGTAQINEGHIGYIEYIYKFFHIPDMDPYEHFGYYHPPLHHIIEAFWLTIQRFIGVPEPLAFENLQVPTLIYSGLCMLVMLHILEECNVPKKLMSFGMLLFAFHPRMMVLAGSVNNDILALLLLLVTIWRALVWIREKTVKNIIPIALALGLGMVSKLNTAICAFSLALVFMLYLFEVTRTGNLVLLRKIMIQYVVFALVCIPIGVSYIARNLILFGERPGIPSPAIIPGESVMYTGEYSVWSIIGLPALSEVNVSFPFHPISAQASHNTWVILFQTGLFAEGYPTDINDFLLAFAQVAYVASIIVAIVTTVVFFSRYIRKLVGEIKAKTEYKGTLFLLSTYIFMLISFGLFVFKYPYTCSSDFRYMTAALVFTSLGFVACQEQQETASSRALRFIINTGMTATLICSLIVYINWNIY